LFPQSPENLEVRVRKFNEFHSGRVIGAFFDDNWDLHFLVVVCGRVQHYPQDDVEFVSVDSVSQQETQEHTPA